MNRRSYKKEVICALAAAVNLSLFIIKLYVAISSNSISIYVDSLNSLADMLICGIAVAGFILSAKKPTDDFPFGLGRAEYVVNFLLSFVIFFTGLAFIYTSLQRLMYPTPVWYSVKYAVTVAATALVKLVMSLVFKREGKALKNEVLKNIGTDSILDFFISACIVISFTLTEKLGYAVDSITGIVAAIIIAVSGLRSLVSSFSRLVGKNDDELCEKAKKLLKSSGFDGEIYSINCHCYGERTVFTVDAKKQDSSDFDTIHNKISNAFNNELNAKIYINLRGEGNE